MNESREEFFEKKGVGVFYLDKEKAGQDNAQSAIADKVRNQQGDHTIWLHP